MADLSSYGLLGIKDAGNLTFYSETTNKPVLYMDYCNTFNVELNAEAVFAMKKGTKAIKWDKPLEGTVTIGMEMASTELFSFLLGSPFKTVADTVFHKREVHTLKTSDEVITLKETTIVADSVVVQKINKDGVTVISDLTTATVATNKVTCTGGVAGDIVAIYYEVKKEAKKFTVSAEKVLNENYKLVCVTTCRLYEGGKDIPIELEFFKVSPQQSVTFAFDTENPSTFEMTVDIMAGANTGEGVSPFFDWKEIPLV